MKTFFRYFCTAHLALTVGSVWILAASIIKGAPPTTTITATKNDNVPGSTSLPPGSNINYTIQISNTGAVSATNLSISDPTPANTTFVAGSLHASPIAVNDSITMVSNVKFYGGVTPPAGQPAVTGSGLFANDITTTDSTILASNSSPSHGTATVNNDGTFIYTPDADFTGADSFTYTVKNNVDATLTDTATVSITVNAPPVAIADGPTNYAAPVNQQLGRTAPGVLRNDTLNGATLTGYGATTGTEQTTIGSATPTAQGGSIVLRADGSFTYTPPAGFSGNDTFKYTLTASLGSGTLVNGAGSSTAMVTIYLDTLPAVTSTVPANNATGVGINSTITINFSEPVDTSAAFSISPNITFSQSPTDGNATSAFTLTPSAALTPGQLYTVTVANFQVADVDGGLSPASNYVFSFTVLPVPAALNDPDTQGSRYQVTENVTYDSALASPASSIFDNDTLNGATTTTYGPTGPTSSTPVNGTTTITTTHGATVLLRVNGTFTYAPANGFTGTDSFFYNIANASGSSRAQVLFNVHAPLIFAPGGIEKTAAALDPALAKVATARTALTQHQLDAAVSAALARWEATGLTEEQLARLRSLKFEVAALSDRHLGEAGGNLIRVSHNAGGSGWFLDVSPRSDAAFGNANSLTRRWTDLKGAPAGRLDMLTVILHEMGHALGFPDTYRLQDRDSIMYGYLTKGERRLPAKGQALGVHPASDGVTHFLTQAINSLPPGKTITLKYAVTIQSNGETTISNTATITGDNFNPVTAIDTETGPGATITNVSATPQITGISPSIGFPGGGTSVVITGSNFTGTTGVKFGSTSAASYTVNRDTQITAVAPAGTGTVDITVTTPNGTSATSAADKFSYSYINGAAGKVTMLANGNYQLEWNTTAGHWYRVSYSSDMIHWFDSPTPVQAGSNTLQWIDSGPPFTDTSPADPSVHVRFYIVNEIVAP